MTTLADIKQNEIELMTALTSLETLITSNSISLEQATLAMTRIEEQIEKVITEKERLINDL